LAFGTNLVDDEPVETVAGPFDPFLITH